MLVHRPPLQCHLASAFQVHDKGRIRKHCALRVAKRDQQPSTTESLIDAQVLEVSRPISHASGLVGIDSGFVGTDLVTQHAHGLAVQAAPDEKFDWVIRYQSRIRVIPLIAGGLGILGVLANRLISGVRLDFSPARRSARDADIMPQSADARHLTCLQYIREGLDIVSLTA